MLKTGIALVVLAAATAARAQAQAPQQTTGTLQLICTYNTQQGEINVSTAVNFDRQTVAGFPAQITPQRLSWQGSSNGRLLEAVIDRYTGESIMTEVKTNALVSKGTCHPADAPKF